MIDGGYDGGLDLSEERAHELDLAAGEGRRNRHRRPRSGQGHVHQPGRRGKLAWRALSQPGQGWRGPGHAARGWPGRIRTHELAPGPGVALRRSPAPTRSDLVARPD